MKSTRAPRASGFISRLMSGGLGVDAYVALASQQFFVYSALEAIADDVRALPQGSSLLFDELTRTPSIARDLEHLVGPDWRAIIMPLPATVRYVDALNASATSLPRYAAHAYTRYLGDLSGGQIIKRMLERHYGLGPEGITFYSFEEIPKSKPFKDVYRERLDGLEARRAAARRGRRRGEGRVPPQPGPLRGPRRAALLRRAAPAHCPRRSLVQSALSRQSTSRAYAAIASRTNTAVPSPAQS